MNGQNTGVVCVDIGFIPVARLHEKKVDINFFYLHQKPCISLVDKFVMDVRDYSAAVSGCTSPTGIVMFWVSFCREF